MTQGVCAECRRASLGQARDQFIHWHAERLMACLDEEMPAEQWRAICAQEQYYERLVTFIRGEDTCDVMVRYVAPSSGDDARAVCEALVSAGAQGVCVDGNEIVCYWHRKAARDAYEKRSWPDIHVEEGGLL